MRKWNKDESLKTNKEEQRKKRVNRSESNIIDSLHIEVTSQSKKVHVGIRDSIFSLYFHSDVISNLLLFFEWYLWLV